MFSGIQAFKRSAERAEAKITTLIQLIQISIYHPIWNWPGPWVCHQTSKRIEMRPLEKLFIQNYPSRQPEKVELSPVDNNLKPGFFEQMKNFTSALRNDNCELLDLRSYCGQYLSQTNYFRQMSRLRFTQFSRSILKERLSLFIFQANISALSWLYLNS